MLSRSHPHHPAPWYAEWRSHVGAWRICGLSSHLLRYRSERYEFGVIKKLAAHRLVVGSDWPYDYPEESLARVLQIELDVETLDGPAVEEWMRIAATE